jgi:uncharacterized protein (UPF0262 family)
MSTANTPITHRKDTPYIEQTIVDQQNSNNKKIQKEHRPSAISERSIIQKYFLICQACFWCASYYTYNMANDSLKFDTFNLSAVQQCPDCSAKDTIESLPIL